MSNNIKKFLATKGNVTVGVDFCRSERFAKRIDFTSSFKETRASSLDALLTVLKQIDFTKEKNIQEPILIFVNQSLYKNIINGYYKNWILTGRTQEGNEISKAEKNLWIEFASIYAQNYLFINLRNTHDARISDSLLKLKGKRSSRGNIINFTTDQLENDKYSAYCWEELNKLYDIDVTDITEVE